MKNEIRAIACFKHKLIHIHFSGKHPELHFNSYISFEAFKLAYLPGDLTICESNILLHAAKSFREMAKGSGLFDDVEINIVYTEISAE